MEVRIRHGEGKQIEAQARFHRLVCDRPFNEGGGDTGMTAPELMLSALGCCAMHCAAEFLRTRLLPRDNMEVRVSAATGGNPGRLTEVEIEVEVPELSARRRDGLFRAVRECLLHQSLIHPPKVKVSLLTMSPIAQR